MICDITEFNTGQFAFFGTMFILLILFGALEILGDDGCDRLYKRIRKMLKDFISMIFH